jgi:hypothetical protein
MLEFFAIAFSLPAAPFGALLLLSLGFWGIALVGGLDLDGAEGAADGVAEGALDGVTEAAEGPPPGTSTMTRYVPITAWLALFAGWGWITAFTISWSLRHPLAGAVPDRVGSYGGLVLAVIAGFVGARITSRPLAPFFQTQPARQRSSIVGEVAEVTTDRVDGRFGQARLMAGGDDLLIQVRCDRADNGLSRGRQALIVAFDDRREAFVVEPISPEA